jgi:hypothetical protein
MNKRQPALDAGGIMAIGEGDLDNPQPIPEAPDS